VEIGDAEIHEFFGIFHIKWAFFDVFKHFLRKISKLNPFITGNPCFPDSRFDFDRLHALQKGGDSWFAYPKAVYKNWGTGDTEKQEFSGIFHINWAFFDVFEHFLRKISKNILS